MNIGFFCPHSDPLADLGEPDAGGQCLYEAKVAKAMATAGHHVESYTRRYGDKSKYQVIAANAPVHRVTMGDNAFLRKEDMGPFLPEFMRNVIAEHGSSVAACDIYHGHYWDGGVAALTASLAYGKPLVFTSHSLGMLKRDTLDASELNYPVRIPAEHRVMRAADRIIALSTIEKAALVDRYHIDADKINIVPGGVDVAAFKPRDSKAALKSELGISTTLLVLCVGRLDERKGFVPFIECLPHVVKAVQDAGQSVTFLMPGGSDNLNEEEAKLKATMLERVEALNLTPHMSFFSRPSDDELTDMYAAADVFACPSLYEPFGLVLVEAMAAGTAVVGTNRGGPNDIVDQGVDGYLADPEDANAFADAVCKVLLLDAAARDAMHQKAKLKAEQRYAWSAVSEQIIEVYSSVVADQRSSHRL